MKSLALLLLAGSALLSLTACGTCPKSKMSKAGGCCAATSANCPATAECPADSPQCAAKTKRAS